MLLAVDTAIAQPWSAGWYNCDALLPNKMIDAMLVEVTPGLALNAIGNMFQAREGVEYWANGNWHKQPLASLPQRTDVRVIFAAPS